MIGLEKQMAKDKKLTMEDYAAASRKNFGAIFGKPKYDRYSSGVPFVDRIFGGSVSKGGVPRGGIIEISGENATGKTTLCLTVARSVLNISTEEEGILVLDFEHSMDMHYARRGFGIELDGSDPRVIYLRPFTIDDARSILAFYLKMAEECNFCPIKLVIIDSVAAMNPAKFLAGAMDTGEKSKDIGLKARELASLFSEYSGVFEKFGITCIFTNQLRSNIKLNQYEPGPAEDTTGGKAMKFYAWIRVFLKHKGFYQVKWWDPESGLEEKRNLFREVEVSTIKNKTAAPFLSDRLFIRHGSGFDNSMTAVVKGQNYGLFHPDSKDSAADKERHKQCYVTGDGRSGFRVWRYQVDPTNPWYCQVEDKKSSNGMRIACKQELLVSPSLVDLADDLKKEENKAVWQYLILEVLRHYRKDEELFMTKKERSALHAELLDDIRAQQDAESSSEREPVSEEEAIVTPDTLPARTGVEEVTEVISCEEAPTDEELKEMLEERKRKQDESMRKAREARKKKKEEDKEEEKKEDIKNDKKKSGEKAKDDSGDTEDENPVNLSELV